MRLYKQLLAPADKVGHELAEDYKQAAGRYWDLFYKRNGDKFFKDRHYFDKEFPELLQGALTMLEVGCGVGNSVFPLIDINPQIQVYACDFSPTAVQLVQSHPQYTNSGRVKAFVADITADPLLEQLPGQVVDYCSMVFVLSAVAPEKMPKAIQNVAAVLKPGSGRVLFRDYAAGDLAQTRLEEAAGVKLIDDSFYVRGDGTCCYYYTEEGLKDLFAGQGLVCESIVVHARLIENRKTGVQMNRRWIQAVFRYAPEPTAQDLQPQQQQQWQQAATTTALPGPPSMHQERLRPQFPPQQQLQQQAFLSQCSSSSHTMLLGSRHWLLPGCLAGSAVEMLGTHMARLAGQQGCSWLLGKRLLLAPPWLQLQPECQLLDQAGGALQLFQHQPQKQPTEMQAFISHDPHWHLGKLSTVADQQSSTLPGCCRHKYTPQQQQQQLIEQGAGAALLALMALWYGAKRVFVCLPDMVGPYATAFQAVVQLNECTVVCERIRLRVWQLGELRQLQMLQRELVGGSGVQQAPIDVVVASSCCCYTQPQQLPDVQAQTLPTEPTGWSTATPAGGASADDGAAVSKSVPRPDGLCPTLQAGVKAAEGASARHQAADDTVALLAAVQAFMQQLADVQTQQHSSQGSRLQLLVIA